MGGTVAVDLGFNSASEHGPGSRFVARLPFSEAPPLATANDEATLDVPLVLRGPYRALIVRTHLIVSPTNTQNTLPALLSLLDVSLRGAGRRRRSHSDDAQSHAA